MRRERRGFTMLEAVVALAIIGLVCVGTLGAYGGSLRAAVTATEKLPLAALARERLTAVDLGGGSLSSLTDSLARGRFTPPYSSATWLVSTTPVRGVDGLFDLRVEVRDGSDRFALRTRRYRPPMAQAPGP